MTRYESLVTFVGFNIQPQCTSQETPHDMKCVEKQRGKSFEMLSPSWSIIMGVYSPSFFSAEYHVYSAKPTFLQEPPKYWQSFPELSYFLTKLHLLNLNRLLLDLPYSTIATSLQPSKSVLEKGASSSHCYCFLHLFLLFEHYNSLIFSFLSTSL